MLTIGRHSQKSPDITTPYCRSLPLALLPSARRLVLDRLPLRRLGDISGGFVPPEYQEHLVPQEVEKKESCSLGAYWEQRALEGGHPFEYRALDESPEQPVARLQDREAKDHRAQEPNHRPLRAL